MAQIAYFMAQAYSKLFQIASYSGFVPRKSALVASSTAVEKALACISGTPAPLRVSTNLRVSNATVTLWESYSSSIYYTTLSVR